VSDRPRIAIVTGAGQGLGEAIARRLAANGMHVVVADVAADRARRVAADIDCATSVAVDVRDSAGMSDLVDSVRREHGTIDALVNNAAVTANTPIWEIDEKAWDDVLAVNLRSVFFNCQLVGPIMREQGWGRIVNLASLAGQQGGIVAGAHYAASKAGVIVLTKIFARELAPNGVTVNAVAPAAIDGPVMQTLPADKIEQIAASIPVRRLGQPDEVAALVAFLCSEEAGYLTGATVDINGGVSMR
jgi:3-oxoacyl-[acyl-carrier protein] reductase